MRRLVLAPHMDDESLGCGGLLAKFPDECHVVTAATSGPVRDAEHVRALAELGVTSHENLGFEDGRVGVDMPALVRALDQLMVRHRPRELYLPYPSIHQDHIAVYEAGMRACRVSMTPGHWVPDLVLVYDIAVYDLNLYPTSLTWNVFEVLTEEQAERKARACGAYETEIPDGPHPMTSIKEIAAAVGKVRKVPYAEQYALVRQVRR